MNPSLFYLLTPDGIKHDPGEDARDTAERCAILLFTHDWVEICAADARSRWTCIARDTSGAPDQIVIEELNGDMQIVNREE